MSIKWMSVVWDDAEDVEGTTLLVLLALADYADKEGSCFPSVASLCQRTRRAERTVQDSLAELEEKGWLGREPRAGRSTVYQLRTPAAHRTPADSAPPQPTAGDPRNPPQLPPQPAAPITISNPQETDVGVVPEVTTEDPPLDDFYCPFCHHPWGYHDTERGCTMPLDASGMPVSRTTRTAGPCACSVAPPEVSTVEHPFPTFAKAALADHTTAEKNDWIAAWETVDSIAKAWEPTMHLTKYLADRKRNQRRPIAEEWVKWFVQDEHAAQADAAASVEDERDSRPWYE